MIDADLVLIHGFWSSPDTWNRLCERFQADEELQGLRVGRFGYESPKLPIPLLWTRVPDYNDIAQSLDSYLSEQTRQRPTAIVTHSQGGLILQRFLAWMLNEGRGHELAPIQLIVMLACPNEGTEYKRSIRKMAGFGRHAQARDLRVLSADVTDARRTVLRQIVNASELSDRSCPIPIVVYSGRTDRIVTRASAQSAFPVAKTLPGNHFSILDPEFPGNLTFATLKRHILDVFSPERAKVAGQNDAHDPAAESKPGSASETPAPDEPLEAVPVLLDELPEAVHGRESLLRQLEDHRRKGGLVVLVGAGGMGKSTLARELVRRTAVPDPPPEWEVSAATFERLVYDLRVVATNLDGSTDELAAIRDGDRAGPDCLYRLLGRARAGWLLIIDNADELGPLGKPGRSADEPPDPPKKGTGWVRAGGTGLVLVTSRQGDREQWPRSADFIRVGALDVKAAAELLRELAPNAGSDRRARALARRLGCLPLALRLAGLYLGSGFAEKEHASFDTYRAALEADPRVIQVLKRYADDPSATDPEAVERMLIMRTWELSLDALAGHGLPQARPLLRLLSCFAPAVPIPFTLVQGARMGSFLAACSEPGRKPPQLNQVLYGLDHLGLITLRRERGLVVHPVVADTNRIHLMEGQDDDPSEETVRATAVTLLADELAGLTVNRPSAWRTFGRLTPHLRALLTNSAPRLSGAALDTLTGTTGQVAIGFGHMRQPAVGVEMLNAVLAPRQGQARVGPVFLLARQQLACLHDDADEHSEAGRIWRAVHRAQLRDWPADHPIVLAARHNIIVSLSYHWPRERIRPYFDQLLADEVRALGADHPVTLETRQAYALQTASHDGWDSAEESLRGIIDDATPILGDDHPFTLGARHNLAQVLRRLNRDDEADAAARRLIEDEKRVLGDDHLLTAATARLGEGGFITTCPFSVPQLHPEFALHLLRKGYAMTDGPKPKRESALQVFDDLVAHFGDDTTPEIREIVADGIHNKALLLEEMCHAPEAIAAYDDLIARYDGDELIGLRHKVAIAFHNKAVFSLGHSDQALEAAQQALSRYQQLADDKPDDFTEHAANAKAFVEEIRSNAPQLMFEHANTRVQKGCHAEALAVLNRVIDRYGDDTSEQVRALVAKAMVRKGILLSSPPPSVN